MKKLCKYCQTKPVFKYGSMRCEDVACAEAARLAKGHHRGKKRPLHGDKVRKKLQGVPKSESHKANLKVNTDHYKKAMLINANIEFTEDNYIDLWRKLLVAKRTSKEYKLKCINSWFGASEDDVCLSDEEIDRLYKMRNTEKSVKAMKSHPCMGSGVGIRTKMIDMKGNNCDVTVKSDFEKRFITDFLERLDIKWTYEQLEIVTNVGTYVPDFVIEIDNCPAIVEIKGSIPVDKVDKILEGSVVSLQKGYRYFFLQRGYFKTMKREDLYQYEITKESPLTQDNLQHIYERKKHAKN